MSAFVLVPYAPRAIPRKCSRKMAVALSREKVLVTGCTGRTGKLVMDKLLQRPEKFDTYGFARDEEKAAKMFGDIREKITIGSVLSKPELRKAMQGMNTLIILTSAIPIFVKPPDQLAEGEAPTFRYVETPEQIDGEGHRNEIDVAKESGVNYIVLVSSLGTTSKATKSSVMGNILFYKREAEEYLVKSGIDYTIVHPGGLSDREEGMRKIVFSKHDEVYETGPLGIPRGDVAEVVVQCLLHESAKMKSFDVTGGEVESSPVTTDYAPLFEAATEGL